MTAVVTLSSDSFDAVVNDAELMIVDFYADWCGPCRRLAPLFDRAAGRHGDIKFGKVDIEAQPELKDRFAITGVPTLVVMRRGAVVWRQWGAFSNQQLEELIGQARANDFPTAA
jgi:thioredoxin 1